MVDELLKRLRALSNNDLVPSSFDKIDNYSTSGYRRGGAARVNHDGKTNASTGKNFAGYIPTDDADVDYLPSLRGDQSLPDNSSGTGDSPGLPDQKDYAGYQTYTKKLPRGDYTSREASIYKLDPETGELGLTPYYGDPDYVNQPLSSGENWTTSYSGRNRSARNNDSNGSLLYERMLRDYLGTQWPQNERHRNYNRAAYNQSWYNDNSLYARALQTAMVKGLFSRKGRG